MTRSSKAYQAKFNDYPRLGSVVGYHDHQGGGRDPRQGRLDRHREADRGGRRAVGVDTPFGAITFRAIDHQSTLGAFVGKTALKDGKGVMVDCVYREGADYLPSDAEVEKMRPKE